MKDRSPPRVIDVEALVRHTNPQHEADEILACSITFTPKVNGSVKAPISAILNEIGCVLTNPDGTADILMRGSSHVHHTTSETFDEIITRMVNAQTPP